MKPHKRLEVWKRAIEFVTEIYKVTELFPPDERFGLISQIRRSAVSIPSNISEGAARKTIEFVKATQNLEHPNPGIRGGVKGSFPFDGPYGQYEMLNWAAKFLCDALGLINDQRLGKKRN